MIICKSFCQIFLFRFSVVTKLWKNSHDQLESKVYQKVDDDMGKEFHEKYMGFF